MATIIQLRHDTATNWTTNNPLLADGEVGLETDTKKMKMGDGTTRWNNLSYFGGSVTSVNGQTGAVTLSIPDDTSDLTNGAGFITGIDSTDVTTALGYTPYNSSNPDGYITSSALTNYQQQATITALSATDSITLADNTIYNGSEQTALTIATPTSATVDFICQINFTSGTTATTLTSTNVNYIGEDTSSNVFTPVASKRYTVVIYYDGVNFVGVVKGI